MKHGELCAGYLIKKHSAFLSTYQVVFADILVMHKVFWELSVFVLLPTHCLCHNVCAKAAPEKPALYLLAKYACFITLFLLERLRLAMLGEGPSRRVIGFPWNSRKVDLRVVTVTDHSQWALSTPRQLRWVRRKVHLWQCPHCPLSSNKLGLRGEEQSQIATPSAAGGLGTAVIPPSDTLPASKYFQLNDFPSYVWFLIS